jgi:PAS domain-containing protein
LRCLANCHSFAAAAFSLRDRLLPHKPEMRSQNEIEESFHAGQTRILEMVAADTPLPEILKSVVLLMEAQVEGMLCSILVLTTDGRRVRHGAAPSLPAAYVTAVNGSPIGPRHGSCGTAMFLKRPVVVTDVLTDPLWTDYRELAQILNLSACWSTPIFSPRGDVLGSFAIYRREQRGPNAQEKRLTQVATHIAGIAIERQRAQETLREREARINLAAESADLAFWVIYPEHNSAWMSDKGRLMYGFDSALPLSRELICSRVHPDERKRFMRPSIARAHRKVPLNPSTGSSCLMVKRAGSLRGAAVCRSKMDGRVSSSG